MSRLDSLQKYLWTAMGMRPTESEFGSMPYYRMADVEDLVRKMAFGMELAPNLVHQARINALEETLLSTRTAAQGQIEDLVAKLWYLIEQYNVIKTLEEGIFTFPDGDSWDLHRKDVEEWAEPWRPHQWVVRENEFPEDERCELCDMLKSTYKQTGAGCAK